MTKEDINSKIFEVVGPGAPPKKKIKTSPPRTPPVLTHQPPVPTVQSINIAGATVKAIQDNAKQLGLTWTMRPATTTGVPASNPQSNNVQVIYDGDTVAITAQSLIGIPPNSSRVMCIQVPPSGNFIIGSLDNNPIPGQVIARAFRASASSGSTGTETGYLRLDNIPVQKGRLYLVLSSSIPLDSSISNDIGRVFFRVATGGTSATTASTLFQLSQTIIPNTSFPEFASMGFTYSASADDTLSILLSFTRATGTGTITITGSATNPVEFWVIQSGTDPGNTGAAL